jgi:HlyD family secretion protein
LEETKMLRFPGIGVASPLPYLTAVAFAIMLCFAPTLRAQPEKKQAKPLQVPSEVRGIVKELLVKEGQRVKKDDVLLRLDDRSARLDVELAELRVQKAKLEIDSAKATSGEAKAQFDRAMAVHRANPAALSQEELSMRKFVWERHEFDVGARQVDLKTAQMQLRAAQLQLDTYVIRAPIDGVVYRIQRRPGEAVRDLQTVVQIRIDSGKE